MHIYNIYTYIYINIYNVYICIYIIYIYLYIYIYIYRNLGHHPESSKKSTFSIVLPRNTFNKTTFGKRAFFRYKRQHPTNIYIFNSKVSRSLVTRFGL